MWDEDTAALYAEWAQDELIMGKGWFNWCQFPKKGKLKTIDEVKDEWEKEYSKIPF